MTTAYLKAIEAIKSDIADKEAKIQPMREQLAAREAELTPLKLAANQLCKLAGIPELFAVDEAGTPADQDKQLRFRKDQFFNKTLGQAVFDYLTARSIAAGGEPSPASTDEIYSALTSHGYKFVGTSEANNKRALKIALVRNTTYIAKVSDDLFGLRKWYGMRASRRTQAEEIFGDTPEADEPDSMSATSGMVGDMP
ncbi:MAG TPA: hypothetical protein VK717_02535 [Opitutaceae bacterium]|jgi:hypothetical protein|nr:hypothetical protein [Opitutaceae bacterium]